VSEAFAEEVNVARKRISVIPFSPASSKGAEVEGASEKSAPRTEDAKRPTSSSGNTVRYASGFTVQRLEPSTASGLAPGDATGSTDSYVTSHQGIDPRLAGASPSLASHPTSSAPPPALLGWIPSPSAVNPMGIGTASPPPPFPEVHSSSAAPAGYAREDAALTDDQLLKYQDALRRLLPELRASLGAGVELKCNPGFDLSIPRGTLPTKSALTDLCVELAADPRIRYDLVAGGCAERAHIFAFRAQALGFNVEKVFVGGPNLAHNWWHHVGVLVFSQENASAPVEANLVDLALCDDLTKPRPMEFGQWIKKFNRGREVEVEIWRRDQVDSPFRSYWADQPLDAASSERAYRDLAQRQQKELGTG
jgi:hypothetical protein